MVTTRGDDNRSVVFVDREDGVPAPPSDDDRAIDDVGVQMQPSCARLIGYPRPVPARAAA